MSLAEWMRDRGARPSGISGRLAGMLMNRRNRPLYGGVIASIRLPHNPSVLDIGCGGGHLLKILHGLCGGHVCGLDHSRDMIWMAAKTNRRIMEAGTAAVVVGSVLDLPFGEGRFDLVTAFDTIQFWPDHGRALREVHRVLRAGGVFTVFNQFPAPGSSWYGLMRIRDEAGYLRFLGDAGFGGIQSDMVRFRNWILLRALKNV